MVVVVGTIALCHARKAFPFFQEFLRGCVRFCALTRGHNFLEQLRHRVGRTARAGSHGVALTLCNDEERKDIKKLIRKLNQNLTTYMVPPKLVKQLHDFITDKLDPVVREIELEQIQC